MIAVIHSNGTSFKGLMNYLLTGKDGQQRDRVAFTHTENLASPDPQVGYKVMIATAKMQEELKARANIKNTGRKSPEVVQHITLSWAKDEAVDNAEMIAAARGALTYLGVSEGEKLNAKQKAKRTHYADRHQVILVAHKDRDHKHCHLVINRIDPQTGVMLPENRNFEKLSAWALDYRRSMGMEHLCPKRSLNAAKRAQGYLVNHPRKPRSVYEREQELAEASPDSRKKAQLEEVKRRIKMLAQKQERLTVQRETEFRDMGQRYLAGENTQRKETAAAVRQAKASVKRDYVGRVERLHEQQAREKQAFKDAQATIAGRVKNAWSALQSKEWLSEIRVNPLRATTQAFRLAIDSGLQAIRLDQTHVVEQKKLKAEEKAKTRAAVTQECAKLRAALSDQRKQYETERSDLVLRHGMEKAKLKAEWKQVARDRAAALAEGDRRLDPPTQPTSQELGTASPTKKNIVAVEQTLKPPFDQAASPEPSPAKDEGREGNSLMKSKLDRRARRRQQDRERDENDRGL